METSWNDTKQIRPNNGERVWWMMSDGSVVAGIYASNLWWPGDSQEMYVYYDPQYWKPRHEAHINAQTRNDTLPPKT
jgi:hypothetical protein